MNQLVRDGDIIPLADLTTQYDLKESKVLQYLQLKSVIKSYLSKGIIPASKGVIDEKLKAVATKQGTVSALYKMLIQSLPDSTVSTKLQWEKDIGSSLTKEQWEAIIKNSSLCSKCVHYKIIQMKIIHRAYVTPKTLKKMNSNLPDLCWHGCGRIGTLKHLLWSCPAVKQFWNIVIEFIQDLLGVQMP